MLFSPASAKYLQRNGRSADLASGGECPSDETRAFFTIQVQSHFTTSNPLHYLNRLIPGSPFLADIQPLHGQHWQNTHCSVPFECHYVIRRHYILEYRLLRTHPVCKLMHGKLGACLCSITVQCHYLSLLLSFTTSTMPSVF